MRTRIEIRMRSYSLIQGRLAPMLLSCLPMLPHTAKAQQPRITTLAAMREQSRPLLIFAPKPDDPQLGLQLRTLDEHSADAHDRQLVPIALPYQAPANTAVQFTTAEADTLRRRFHIAPADFAVILIGKDGGPKLHSMHPLSITKLNATIDAMPMRQEEMRAPAPGR